MAVFIKIKAPDANRWEFLTPKGGLTHLRIHASMFDNRERAEIAMRILQEDNPTYQFKVTD